jgi:sugar phosphate isomerase/epimerase
MTMLLTLSAGSLSTLVSKRDSDLGLFDLPDFAIRQLELRGLNIPASMLSGFALEDLDVLRDRADKAACPCLVLFEDGSLDFANASPAKRQKAKDRVQRLAVAANRLGCNSLGLRCDAPDSEEIFDLVSSEIKEIMPQVERLELNVLIAPGEGLTDTPDRLTDLIKRIGGFRIGSLPSFAHAAGCGNPVEALRKLAPYAGAVQATVKGFVGDGGHVDYDLTECVHAIRSVGFVNTVAIDYVGDKDPVENIDRARQVLQEAIDAELSSSSTSSADE